MENQNLPKVSVFWNQGPEKEQLNCNCCSLRIDMFEIQNLQEVSVLKGSPTLHWQPAQASVSAQVQDIRANPHRCPPLPCVCLRLTPSALHLHITGLTPVTSHHCHMHAKSLQLQKCTHLARALTAACGSGFGLISSRWSTQLGSPANSPQHYKGICSWLSIAKRVHITTSGHHHCLS